MGKTSTISALNLPGRYAWSIAESTGPINMLFILYNLPEKLHPRPSHDSSFAGTGLPAQNEILGLLFILHYLNRALITPLFFAPSMSPIHAIVASIIATFQFMNSSNIACWLVYSTLDQDVHAANYPLALIGVLLFLLGLQGNIMAEHKLFDLRRGAAKRKARSEGKAVVTYDKVYVIPPTEGFFKYNLFPHYTLEWLEWTGYWIFGGALGLGWNTPALWFLIAELSSMMPRAVDGRKWYAGKFGEKRLGGRGGVLPVSWL
jgi:3-oxo-5-alpha-steroid 4-dehydrogenase 1